MVQIYAGLDVSDKSTHICLVDEAGSPVWCGVCASDPQVLADVLKKRWPEVARVVLETGALSSFLYHGLVERRVPNSGNSGDTIPNSDSALSGRHRGAGIGVGVGGGRRKCRLRRHR